MSVNLVGQEHSSTATATTTSGTTVSLAKANASTDEIDVVLVEVKGGGTSKTLDVTTTGPATIIGAGTSLVNTKVTRDHFGLPYDPVAYDIGATAAV